MTVRVLSWDWRGQPDLDQLAQILIEISDGQVHLHQVDTGSDDYAIVVADRPLTRTEADSCYRTEMAP